MIRWDRERQRFWVAGYRWHHGLTGVILGSVGVLLMWHDWKDRREWLRTKRADA